MPSPTQWRCRCGVSTQNKISICTILKRKHNEMQGLDHSDMHCQAETSVAKAAQHLRACSRAFITAIQSALNTTLNSDKPFSIAAKRGTTSAQFSNCVNDRRHTPTAVNTSTKHGIQRLPTAIPETVCLQWPGNTKRMPGT